MAIKTYDDQNFVAIANAIRAKNGETTQYKPSEMAPAIMAIESGLELLPQDTAAGAIANFPDGSNNYPVVELIANIDPKQAGSGDPSPSNVRPISGSTECNIVKAGKNLINVTNTSGTVNGVTFTVNSDSSITCNGTATALTAVRIIAPSGSPINFERGKVYTLSGCPSGGSEQTFQLDLRLNNSTGTFYSNAKDFGNGFTWTDNVGGAAYPIILIRSGYTCNNLTFNPQIEIGSAATAFEAYSEEVKTISWESEAGTVYGGTLNVTTGELTVKGILEVFNQVSSDRVSSQINSFIKNSGTIDIVGDYTRITFAVNSGTQTQYNKASNTYPSKYQICNIAPHVFSYNAESNHWYRNNVLYLFLPTSICGSTAQSVYDYLVSIANTTPLTFFLPYSSGNEQTYQLTPEQVKTLLGVNNIYADTGDVEVTYRADIDLYIAKKIAEGA